MVSQPYNTREDVNRNLTKWGESGPNKVLLDALQTQYPKAESALAGYYAKEFRKKPREAKELARTILDLAYRSHFVFPKAH